jgi:hypothetical protein
MVDEMSKTFKDFNTGKMCTRYFDLYYDGNIVAKEIENNLMLPLSDYVPPSLFGVGKEKHLCRFSDFEKWLFKRILPKTRENIKEVLLDNNIDHYDEWAILYRTMGAMNGQDNYYINWRDVLDD